MELWTLLDFAVLRLELQTMISAVLTSGRHRHQHWSHFQMSQNLFAVVSLPVALIEESMTAVVDVVDDIAVFPLCLPAPTTAIVAAAAVSAVAVVAYHVAGTQYYYVMVMAVK